LGVKTRVTWGILTKNQLLPSNSETSIMAEKANTATRAKGKTGGMTKAEAIRQAIAHLGKDAKPLELRAHIKNTFGIDITTDHISAVKTEIIRKMSSGAKPAPVKAVARTTTAPKLAAKKQASKKPAAKELPAPAPQAKPAPTGASNGKASGTVALADVATVKALLGRVGPTNLKTLIEVLAT
jgi:hypothetical protein